MMEPTVPRSSSRLTQLALVAGALLAVAILLLAAAVIVLAGRLSVTRQELASARERTRQLEAQLAILAAQIVPGERPAEGSVAPKAASGPVDRAPAATRSATKPGARGSPAASN